MLGIFLWLLSMSIISNQQNSNVMFDPDNHPAISTKQILEFTPQIDSEYRAFEIIYPKDNHRFEKAGEKNNIEKKSNPQPLPQNQVTEQHLPDDQNHEQSPPQNEDSQQPLSDDENPQENTMDNELVEQVNPFPENSEENPLDSELNRQDIDIEESVPATSQLGDETRDSEREFKNKVKISVVPTAYSLVPHINEDYKVTDTIYPKEKESSDQRFGNKGAADKFVKKLTQLNDILKKELEPQTMGEIKQNDANKPNSPNENQPGKASNGQPKQPNKAEEKNLVQPKETNENKAKQIPKIPIIQSHPKPFQGLPQTSKIPEKDLLKRSSTIQQHDPNANKMSALMKYFILSLFILTGIVALLNKRPKERFYQRLDASERDNSPTDLFS